MYRKEFMEMAVKEAREGIANGDGGPFGAIVVKDGEVIASGHNRVLFSNDSTCHGKIDAIRKVESLFETDSDTISDDMVYRKRRFNDSKK